MHRALVAFSFALLLPAQAAQVAGRPAPAAEAADKAPAPAWQEQFTWRCLGPANMGGRITDFAVCPSDPSTFWVATATAGLLKTTNNGATFEHQFDHEACSSVGAVAVAASDPNVVWVGTGENNPRNSVSYGNGVYKSTDGGKTWKHMGLPESFQIGDILVHPKDPNIVYVGALGRLYGSNGERGLYKSTDGGGSWERILFVDDDSGVIDMAMHPTDPDVLLVATYERARDIYDTNDPVKKWGPGSGLYRTEDGGRSFTKVQDGLPSGTLGRIGLDWYGKDPNVVYAIVESEMIGKPGAKVGWAGVAGENAETGARLTQVTKDGPAEKAGLAAGDVVLAVDDATVLSYRDLEERLAQYEVGDTVKVEIAREGKSHVKSVVMAERPAPRQGRRRGGAAAGGEAETQENSEAEASPETARFAFGARGGMGGDPERTFGISLGGQRSNAQGMQGKAGHEHGGIYRSADAGRTWTRVNSINPRPMYFSQVRVDPSDETYQWVLGVSLARSKDKGATFTDDGGRGVHADQHAMWIDPRDGRHVLLGCDGGVYVTYDRGENWDHLNHAALGQFYHVDVSSRRDYWVFGGLQDNGSWGAPHRSASARGTVNEDWVRVGGGDGFVVRLDPDDPDQVYYESQNGGTGRTNLRTMESGGIRPRAERGMRYRFNWKTPFILSAHNSRVYYSAAQFVFRSWNKGDDLKVISPEITRGKLGSATALAESPRDPDVLYVGSDDGALWMTRDGGKEWKDLWVLEPDPGIGGAVADTESRGGPRVASAQPVEEPAPLAALVPGPRYVAAIEPSRFKTERVYLTLDAHRSDDDDPYVFVSEDHGQTWRALRANLPRGSTHALREDRVNENLLYLGTEFGFWVSFDRGASWERFHNNLPTVPVHDIAQHRSCGDIVLATHGRSLWALDVTPLRQMTKETRAAAAHLYDPADVVVWRRRHSRGTTGGSPFFGDNPDGQASIFFSLGADAGNVVLRVESAGGETLATLEAPKTAGLHRVVWDLRRPAPPQPQGGAAQGRRGGRGGGAAAAGGGGRGRGRGFGRFRPEVAPGSYRVVLEVDGEQMNQTFEVQADPNFVGIGGTTETGTDIRVDEGAADAAGIR
ncbi:MAG: PDZ domain-containing protein [Planctomycetota bacterium]